MSRFSSECVPAGKDRREGKLWVCFSESNNELDAVKKKKFLQRWTEKEWKVSEAQNNAEGRVFN